MVLLFMIVRPAYAIIRDYLMAFGYRPKYQPEIPIISSRALAGGLIMVEG